MLMDSNASVRNWLMELQLQKRLSVSGELEIQKAWGSEDNDLVAVEMENGLSKGLD